MTSARRVEMIDVEAIRVSESLRAESPRTPSELAAWVRRRLGVTAPDRGRGAGGLDGHAGPLEYLVHVFFEGRFVRGANGGWVTADPQARRAPDCVVWANRGGGKTFLGAVATLLDLAFKPATQVRILAGSLEQSKRMHEHVRALLERSGLHALLDAKITTRSAQICSGSAAALLAASHESVRGTRVQKLRCDEVDLFDPELWRAAQLVTRSVTPAIGPWGSHVQGSVEALSTMHRPHGLMWELALGGDGGPAWPVFRWGVVDVLERCEPRRACEGCGLWDECAGRAKSAERIPGHVRIDDAIALKSRVDRETWACEMLCRRPSTRQSVYPEFDPALHVAREEDPRLSGEQRGEVRWYAAMDFGVRSESVVLLAGIDEHGLAVVERESIATDQPAVRQADVLREWVAGGACGAIQFVAIDPAGFARSDQTGLSNGNILYDAGWRVRGPRAAVQTGVRLVRQRLAPADGRAPSLLISRRCPRLIECMQRYHYPERDAGGDEPVKDGFDHACDALRYLIAALDGGELVRTVEY